MTLALERITGSMREKEGEEKGERHKRIHKRQREVSVKKKIVTLRGVWCKMKCINGVRGKMLSEQSGHKIQDYSD